MYVEEEMVRILGKMRLRSKCLSSGKDSRIGLILKRGFFIIQLLQTCSIMKNMYLYQN